MHFIRLFVNVIAKSFISKVQRTALKLLSTHYHRKQQFPACYLLLNLYGEETTRLTRLFELLRIKKTQLINSLTFLLRCRDHHTTPCLTIPTPHPLPRRQQKLSPHQLCLTTRKNATNQSRT